ncbi:MAG: ATP-binding cassette domain-containing protein [Parcubacteria group bacterium]|nr:ATP-binding cassette domain-containing protein [Parcubacteria group bacterium]
MDSIIKIQNINLWYDKGKPSETQALKDINLEIEKGEYVAFFGPSGSGKTSLLYLIAGIDQPQEGKIYINNKDITSVSKKEAAIYRQIGVGIIFQQFNLIPSLTVLANVALPMAFLGISEDKRKIETLKLLERLGIKEMANRYPFELSGGQQQRVGIARALANNPPIILADEPLGNLDSDNAKRVLEFLKELNKKDGRTIIMVTHEAWSLKDVKRIFYLKDGVVTKTENPTPKTVAESLSHHLYQELTPELTSVEVSAQSLAQLFMRGYSIEEIKRFEFFLLERLKNHIDSDIFRRVLDRPFKQNGVGLWRQKAERISRFIDDIIQKRKEIKKVYEELEYNLESPIRDEVEKIRMWLIEDYHGKLSELQNHRLNELIAERLKSIITPERFKKIANKSKKEYGVGLSFRSTQKISEKLEAILRGQEAYPGGIL